MSAINNVLQYVTGFERKNINGVQYFVVFVNFQEDWTVFTNNDQTIAGERVNDKSGAPTRQCVFYGKEDEVELDNIYDFIATTAQVNADAQQKKVLFDTKVRELKEIFEQNDLETLKGLEFVLPEGSDMVDMPDIDNVQPQDNTKVDVTEMLPKAIRESASKKTPVKPTSAPKAEKPAPKRPSKSRARVVNQIQEGDVDMDFENDDVQTHMTGLSFEEMQKIDL